MEKKNICIEKWNNDQFIKIEDDKKYYFDICRLYINIENEEKFCIDSYNILIIIK